MSDVIYLLFAGDNYYPAGGSDDFVYMSKDFEDAKAHFNPKHADWAEVAVLDPEAGTLTLKARFYDSKWHDEAAP